MEILDIIKESFIFPTKNLDKLAIYIVLLFVIGLLSFGGALSIYYAVQESSVYMILVAILFIMSIVLGFLITGYQVGILKSGIDMDDEAPGFDWKNDIITGIKMVIANIVYMIIPAIIIGIVALITNVPGNVLQLSQEIAANSANVTATANSTGVLASVSEPTMAAFGTSIAITAMVAFVLIIIFSIFLSMGEARLAKTGSLGEALNIPEAIRDIPRIGVGKVIAVFILIFVIIAVIQAILNTLSAAIPPLAILSIIVTPYLTFFSSRAWGLLYSDIA
ncbi:DUF4013 domain-containing protein [Methanobrevibacter sp.]|uniref:DUF4013 domain-containing protein n=1 Tax=Methanobrevibacter sp. TaxID=66852 RepID=UPI00388E957A